jgi:hypothetical protein
MSFVAAVVPAGSAWAQGLPSLPPPSSDAPVPPPPPSSPPPGADESVPPSTPPPPPPVQYLEPPPGDESWSVERVRFRPPRNSLWLGARLGVQAYGGALFVNDLNAGSSETTGNFIRPGGALELDVGARIAYRYIPYVALEVGAARPGPRFEGIDTTVRTTFVGVGFRWVAGDLRSVAFASELSIGFRNFRASNSGGTYDLTGFELFRLGIGAEIRLAKRFTLSPMITFSDGVLTDTSGTVSYGPHQGDGMTGPPYVGSGNVPDFAQTNYFSFVLGCGAHFDLIGD